MFHRLSSTLEPTLHGDGDWPALSTSAWHRAGEHQAFDKYWLNGLTNELVSAYLVQWLCPMLESKLHEGVPDYLHLHYTLCV